MVKLVNLPIEVFVQMKPAVEEKEVGVVEERDEPTLQEENPPGDRLHHEKVTQYGYPNVGDDVNCREIESNELQPLIQGADLIVSLV